MTISINTYGDLLAALSALSPEQLNQPILASPDGQPIVSISSLDITEEDLIQTDEAIEPISTYTNEEIVEWEYPVVYRAGTAFLSISHFTSDARHTQTPC